MAKLIVDIPPAFTKFIGFSIAEKHKKLKIQGKIKRYFPNDKTDEFEIITPDGTSFKAKWRGTNRVEVMDGERWKENLNIKPNDKLEIEVIYRILNVIKAEEE